MQENCLKALPKKQQTENADTTLESFKSMPLLDFGEFVLIFFETKTECLRASFVQNE